jgi:hypothetical protein
MTDDFRKVDRQWKDAVEAEKERARSGQRAGVPDADFDIFLSGLMFDCMVALGEIENPISKKTQTNMPHAKYVIDILDIIKEKTSGNLTDREDQLLNGILYELRMKFIAKSNSSK